MYGVFANISIKNVTKHPNSLARSDLQVVRSRIADLFFSPMLRDLTCLSSSHLPG